MLSVEGQIGAGRIDNGGFFGFTARNVTPMALRAGAEMPLYAGGRVAAAIASAKGGQTMATLAMDDVRSRVIVGAVAAYAEVLTARRIEARYQQMAAELSEVERQAKLRFQSGEIPASDLASSPQGGPRGRQGWPMRKGGGSSQRPIMRASPAMKRARFPLAGNARHAAHAG
jgi:outer membrane protein